jgi:hypothetical protein
MSKNEGAKLEESLDWMPLEIDANEDEDFIIN